ncbi:BA14K family protein [Phenylobacterium sp.]|uniref:BA14K family protein n=1 Tax=Phenylobacterium sp. TaxID=1871053 RepID=UPI0035B0C614
MRNPILASALAAILAVGAVAGPASAQRPPPPSREHYDARRPPPPPGWNQRSWEYRQSYVYRRDHHYDDHSDAVIAGILGFALGAAIAGTQEQKADVAGRLDDPDWIAYCARKYSSFDPRSGTYLGYDGLRHYCR